MGGITAGKPSFYQRRVLPPPSPAIRKGVVNTAIALLPPLASSGRQH